jgi:hypothetical protein
MPGETVEWGTPQPLMVRDEKGFRPTAVFGTVRAADDIDDMKLRTVIVGELNDLLNSGRWDVDEVADHLGELEAALLEQIQDDFQVRIESVKIETFMVE